MNFLLTILSIPGILFVVLLAMRVTLWPTLRSIFHQPNGRLHAVLIILSVSWFLSIGLSGIAGLWGFYLGIHISTVVLVIGVAGLFGWVIGLCYLRPVAIKCNAWVLVTQEFRDMRRWELLTISAIVVQFFIYTYMAVTPWINWDEFTLYGALAKLVGNGWVSTDLFDHHISVRGEILAEITAAQQIFPVSDTYLVRAMRVLNLVFVSIGMYGLIRWLGASPLWSLLSIAGFLVTPDLVWLGTSLKTDAVTMAFEISAALLLIVALVSMLPDYRSKIRRRSDILILAAVLSALAFASRFSGIYFATLVGAVTLFFIIWESDVVRVKAARLFVLASAWIICCVGYLVNVHQYGNPIYPFRAPWPFDGGVYTTTFENWAEEVNIFGLPPVIEQLYLLFHLSLGIEAWTWKFGVDFLPHAKDHASTMLWLSPTMLSIFIIPLFFSKRPSTLIIGAIFILWFVIWSLGFHYSRVFIAGSSLAVIVSAVIASLDTSILSKYQRYTQYLLRVGLVIILVGFLPFQIFKGISDYPSLSAFGGHQARYDTSVSVLRNHPNFRMIDTQYPSFEESKEISNILATYPKAFVHVDISRALNILLQNAYFAELKPYKESYLMFHEFADCVLLNRDSNLSKRQRSLALQEFPDVRFVTNTGAWILHCK